MPTTRRVIALTFDGGGNAAGVASILETLAREKVQGTFFLTGSWVEQFPAQARAIAAFGRVGDHSITHPHFTQLSDAQIRAQVTGAAKTINRVCGVNPAPFFRFPYGDRDARTITAVNAAGYVPVGWTVDTLGWEGTSEGVTVAVVIDRVMGAVRPGAIVLMHMGANPNDGSTLDADALRQVIVQLRAQGYQFVTLDALLAMRP